MLLFCVLWKFRRRGLFTLSDIFHAGVPAQQLPTDSHLVWGSSRSAGCPSWRGRSQPWGRSSTLNRMGSGSVELRGTRRVLTARWRPGDQIPTFILGVGRAGKGRQNMVGPNQRDGRAGDATIWLLRPGCAWICAHRTTSRQLVPSMLLSCHRTLLGNVGLRNGNL